MRRRALAARGALDRRSDFARDRARAAALQRAAPPGRQDPGAEPDRRASTSPATGSPTRSRSRRSVASSASSLGLDPDVVDTACLAHDLGHPPFGHNGERALNDWAADIGGFEGNAQTLRAAHPPRAEGVRRRRTGRYGLNLTRASLDASCKYPWPDASGIPDPSGRSKFGFYDDDSAAFEWMRAGAPDRRRCIEAQVMDLSDDIAYSVHDFEDAIVNGYIDVPALGARVDHDELVDSMFEWIGGEHDHDELIAAFDRLDDLDVLDRALGRQRAATTAGSRTSPAS